MIEFFSSSAALKEFVSKNNVITFHGAYGVGSLLFIDSSDLHVVFGCRSDYESWCAAGSPVQISLF